MFDNPLPIADGTPVLVLTHGLHYAGILTQKPGWLMLSDAVVVFNTGPMANLKKQTPTVDYAEPTGDLLHFIPVISVQDVIALHAVPRPQRTE